MKNIQFIHFKKQLVRRTTLLTASEISGVTTKHLVRLKKKYEIEDPDFSDVILKLFESIFSPFLLLNDYDKKES